MTRRTRRRRQVSLPMRAAAVISAIVVGTLGCSTPRDRGHTTSDASPSSTHGADDASPTPAAPSRGAHVTAALVPLGTIAYDELSLPLLDPHGRRVAAAVGFAPSWSAVLAEPGAPLPGGSAVELRSVAPGDAARLLHRLPSGILLGRSANEHGVLVEQPLDDGSRRIGLCRWESGAIEWIVDDGAVNAHASLSTDGDLVWSRRAVEAPHFDLALRSADGRAWTVHATDDETWLMPELAGSTLFSLRLRDGVLQAVAMDRPTDSGDEDQMRASMRTLTLTNRGTTSLAYQSLASHAGAPSTTLGNADAWIFFHPGEGRMAIWSPEEARLHLLRSGSISAALLDEDRVLLSLADGIVTQRLSDGAVSPPVVDGTHVIRPVTGQPWPLVLLRIGDGAVGLVGFTLTEEEARRE